VQQKERFVAAAVNYTNYAWQAHRRLQKARKSQYRVMACDAHIRGHSLITSHLRERGGGPFNVTLCDREGRGPVDAYIRMGKKL